MAPGDHRLYQIPAGRTGTIDPLAVEARVCDCYIEGEPRFGNQVNRVTEGACGVSRVMDRPMGDGPVCI